MLRFYFQSDFHPIKDAPDLLFYSQLIRIKIPFLCSRLNFEAGNRISILFSLKSIFFLCPLFDNMKKAHSLSRSRPNAITSDSMKMMKSVSWTWAPI